MHREPLGEALSYFHVQAISKKRVNFADRFSYRGPNGRWRKLTELRDQREIVHRLVLRLWDNK